MVFVGMVVGVFEADERLPERVERDVGQAGGAHAELVADHPLEVLEAHRAALVAGHVVVQVEP